MNLISNSSNIFNFSVTLWSVTLLCVEVNSVTLFVRGFNDFMFFLYVTVTSLHVVTLKSTNNYSIFDPLVANF